MKYVDLKKMLYMDFLIQKSMYKLFLLANMWQWVRLVRIEKHV